jgi:hypothetical protein
MPVLLTQLENNRLKFVQDVVILTREIMKTLDNMLLRDWRGDAGGEEISVITDKKETESMLSCKDPEGMIWINGHKCRAK